MKISETALVSPSTTFLGDNIIIGENVVVSANVVIYEGTVIGKGTFIGPGAVIGAPSCLPGLTKPRPTVIGVGVWVGPNSVVEWGATVLDEARIDACLRIPAGTMFSGFAVNTSGELYGKESGEDSPVDDGGYESSVGGPADGEREDEDVREETVYGRPHHQWLHTWREKLGLFFRRRRHPESI